MKVSAAASRSSVESPGRTSSRMSARVPATIRPARPMASISRGDLSVIMLAAEGPPHALGDLVDRADRGDAAHRVPLLVPREDRRGLLTVGAKPRGDGRWVVVGAMLHGATALEPRQDLLVGHVEE